MRGPIQISPSILSADFLNLQDGIELIEHAGCDFIHVDVMDGHFVPNLTIGPPHVKALKAIATVPLDVHLMIANPEEQLEWYLDAGADVVTFHIEAATDAEDIIDRIHARGRKAGITLCPPTPVSMIEPYLSAVDMVLVMSVNPGFSGQSFIEASVDRVKAVCDLCDARGLDPLIEVDGGMNENTIAKVAHVGADVIVAGNAVFKAKDPGLAISDLKAAGEFARVR